MERGSGSGRRTGMRRVAATASLTLILAALPFASVGCSECDAASADCGYVIRYEDTLYSVYSETTAASRRVGTAEQAACDDVGSGCDEPRGAYFPDDPSRVKAYAIDGYSTSRVVGVALSDGSVQIGVAQSLDQREVEKIVRDLTRRQR